MNNLNLKSDDMLVDLYSKGNNQAFDILLNRYKDKLFSYIFFIVRNSVLAEDIFQETFVKAIITLQRGGYSKNGKFGAWLTRIAHNLVIDNFRQERNHKVVSNDAYPNDLFNSAQFSDTNIEEEIVNNQIIDDVRRLIGMLPDNQREVVYMRFYQNLSFKDIADITDVSINTALGRMRYALINMRKMAEEKNIVLTL
ncbi:MAG TPA: sigma-70 family RNA polymerase sigma factor [Bacteroidaceae bacterium]|nr:sigma-70 family RNA polymerase sigma factor [Bacteroidaceae bacterium]